MIVVDQITMDGFKTKTIVEMLKALNVEGKALIVLPEMDQKVIKKREQYRGRENRSGEYAQRL